MRGLLFFVSVITLLMGAVTVLDAKTSMHEIGGYLLLLIAAVLFSAAGIIEAINASKGEIIELRKVINDVTILPDDE